MISNKPNVLDEELFVIFELQCFLFILSSSFLFNPVYRPLIIFNYIVVNGSFSLITTIVH